MAPPNVPGSPASDEFLPASAVPCALQTAGELLAVADEASTLLKHSAKQPSDSPQQVEKPYQVDLVWRNIIAFVYLHGSALYGLWLVVSGQAKFYTFLWAFVIGVCGGVGITAGAHRLWSHRAYKAKWPLRLILAAFQTMAFQNSIYEWCRDHRVHHKFSETNADPHNASRGFFFSHMGWLLCRKHPDVIRKGATVDMSDLKQDPIVMFQHRTYLVLTPLLCFALPVWIPVHYWGENGWISWYVAGMMRYVLSLNVTWLVNSAAHIWGTKPFDKSISPVENIPVAIAAFGEGWHNYHHVFPWDYKAAELGEYRMNVTTAFIDFFAWVGWAFDLKSVPVELVHKRAARTGDGSHVLRHKKRGKHGASRSAAPPAGKQQLHHHHTHLAEGETPLWGWGDKDMLQEDASAAVRECRER